jgi:hypothetical protein
MDNNPFRSQQTPQTGNNSGYMTPSQQQPYYNNNLGYSQPQNGYQPPQPEQQQQPWQYQQQQQNTSMNPQPNTYSALPPSTYNTTTASPSQYSPYSTHNSSLMSSTHSGMNNFGNTYPPFGVQQNTSALPASNNDSMYNRNLMGYQQPQYQQPPQQQQQYNPSNNFYIPPDFGVSTTGNNMFQPQQPKHAPVDASTLLKGTQVRRVECPVCQKMIEGDDMAVNHHVNEHYP